MSQDADPDRTITLAVDGVTVRKTFEPTTFAVPTIKFDIESDRDEPVDLRLVDRIPADFPMDGVGFHPDYGSESWTAFKNNRVVFEATLDPNGSIETVYGIRISDEERAAEFLDEPTVTVTAEDDTPDSAAEPTGDLGDTLEETSVEDLVGEETSGLVRDFIKGDRDLLPGIDFDLRARSGDDGDEAPPPDAADASTDDPIDEVDLPSEELEGLDADGPSDEDEVSAEARPDVDPEAIPRIEEPATPVDPDVSTPADQAGDEATAETPEQPADHPSTQPEPMSQDAESPETDIADEQSVLEGELATRLAAEIEDGTVDEDDLATIADAMGPSLPKRTQTQIQHLQARVSELEAYSDAFGAFLDEEGTGQELIADIDRLKEAVDDLERRLTETTDDLATTAEEVEATQSDLEDLGDDLRSLGDRVDSVTERHDADLDRLDERIDSVDDSLESTTDELADDLDTVAAELESVDEAVTGLLEWRDQLGEMFTGSRDDS